MKKASGLFCVLILSLIHVSVHAEELKNSSSPPNLSLEASEDIKKTKEDLQAKQKKLDERELEIKAREKAVNDELKKLEALRDDLTKTYEQKQNAKNEKVAKLIQTYLTMSPKSVAKVIGTLDNDLAVAVMSQMETQSLGKIMNLMDPKRSSELSELMAGVKKKDLNERAPATAQNPALKSPNRELAEEATSEAPLEKMPEEKAEVTPQNLGKNLAKNSTQYPSEMKKGGEANDQQSNKQSDTRQPEIDRETPATKTN